MTNDINTLKADWNEIDSLLHTIEEVDGGFSRAQRGLVTLAEGQQVFVKVGVDDATRQWAQKEVAVYRFLAEHNYPYIPRLLATNDDESAFALESLCPPAWDWSETWTKARLDKTLQAMGALAAVVPSEEEKVFFEEHAVDETAEGWQRISESSEKQAILREKLANAGHTAVAAALDVELMAERSQCLAFSNEALVHNDLRADNAAWNAATQEVRIVDWNWLQFGDPRFDLAATLTHVQRAGFDILPDYAEILDSEALQWMAGFWFDAATRPIWTGGPEYLRHRQLLTGLTALALSQQLEQMG